MHEVAIVEGLFEQVRAELKLAGQLGPVEELELEIGSLSGVCPDSIRFAFDWMRRDTPLSGASLVIHRCEAHLNCPQCGLNLALKSLMLRCPECHCRQVRITGGNQMRLVSIGLAD